MLDAVAELDAVVGEDSVDLLGNRPDQRRQEADRGLYVGGRVQAKANFDVRR